MRILFVTYSTPESFLDNLSIDDDADTSTLAVETKARYDAGEELILEIGFPGLPNRVLIRATALTSNDGDGDDDPGTGDASTSADSTEGRAETSSGEFKVRQEFQLSPDEAVQRDFLIAVASGRADADWQRRSRRFPMRMPAKVVVKGNGDDEKPTETEAETEDMAKGGIALKTAQAVPDGSQVTVVLKPGDGSEEIELSGTVVWNKEDKDSSEIGIQFDAPGSDPIRRLRQIIRGVRVSGKTLE